MTAPVHTPPAWLEPALPLWRRPCTANGLLAVVDPTADTSPGEEFVGGDDTERLLWIATGVQPERAGLLAAQRPSVRAVSLAPAATDLRRVRGAIQFAHRLGGTRSDNAVSARAHLTSVAAPATVDLSVRIPHLVSVRYAAGGVADMAVWELIPRVAAPDWSRVPPASRAFVEANLRGLLALRRAARNGDLPPTEAGSRLAMALRGRHLSIQFVYRHLDLIRPLLTVAARVRRRPPLTDTPAPVPSADSAQTPEGER